MNNLRQVPNHTTLKGLNMNSLYPTPNHATLKGLNVNNLRQVPNFHYVNYVSSELEVNKLANRPQKGEHQKNDDRIFDRISTQLQIRVTNRVLFEVICYGMGDDYE